MTKEKRVMFSVSELKIKTAQHVLRQANIQSFVVNKMDSAHAGIFGDIELYVSPKDAALAKQILVREEIIAAGTRHSKTEIQKQKEEHTKVISFVLFGAGLLVVAVIVIIARYLIF